MNQGVRTQTATMAAARPASWLRNAGIVLIGSALVAVCAHVALPLYFTPVPLTLQPFAVLLLGLLLAPRLGAATMGAYLLEGAAGLPVFAPGVLGSAGVAHLTGPTAGYLLAYPLAAWLIATLYRMSGRGFGWALGSAAAGNAVILSFGALWLGIFTHAAAGTVLAQAVIPFLPGDALKVAAAAALAIGWQRARGRTGRAAQ